MKCISWTTQLILSFQNFLSVQCELIFFFKHTDNGFKKKEINENVTLNHISIHILQFVYIPNRSGYQTEKVTSYPPIWRVIHF